jgi:hypothetical protein
MDIEPRPAVESYLWEGSTLDCSIDESVDFNAPTPELLGSARWVGHRAEWTVGGQVIARSIEVPDGENGHDVVLADADWLTTRLHELSADIVIGALSERHALPLDDDHFQHMAYSDVWYVGLVTSDADVRDVGPLLRVRRVVDQDPEASVANAELIADEPLDPTSL